MWKIHKSNDAGFVANLSMKPISHKHLQMVLSTTLNIYIVFKTVLLTIKEGGGPLNKNAINIKYFLQKYSDD